MIQKQGQGVPLRQTSWGTFFFFLVLWSTCTSTTVTTSSLSIRSRVSPMCEHLCWKIFASPACNIHFHLSMPFPCSKACQLLESQTRETSHCHHQSIRQGLDSHHFLYADSTSSIPSYPPYPNGFWASILCL